MPVTRKNIQPETLAAPIRSGHTLYSHVVAVEGRRLVFVAGQLARDRAGNVVGKGDMRAQIRQVGENIKAALAAAGATIPFARTRREREASGDPRPSIEERYRSRADYLERVRRAGAALVAQRFMLEEDIELAVTLAARAWDHWTA